MDSLIEFNFWQQFLSLILRKISSQEIFLLLFFVTLIRLVAFTEFDYMLCDVKSYIVHFKPDIKISWFYSYLMLYVDYSHYIADTQLMLQ